MSGTVEGSDMGEQWTRRSVLARGGLVGLASILPPSVLAACANDRTAGGSTGGSTTTTAAASSGTAPSGYRTLSDHEAAVVTEATARLIPGPTDDPAEAGHPGAREAGVTRYIDTMLSALLLSKPLVFAGGPTSDRAGGTSNDMATPARLSAAEHETWVTKLQRVRDEYTAGVVALDRAAGGSFVDASPDQQDAALVADPDGFTATLFSHAIEGMYSVPEYGGNAGGVGWTEIGFAGDSQPRGYDAERVSTSDGPDVYVRDGIGDKLLTLLSASVPH